MNIRNSKSILFILLVIFAWFSPWWMGGKNLAPLDLQNRMMSPWRGDHATAFAKNHIVSDAVDQYLVYRMVAAENYRNEGWLGWSSLTYGGTAEYANTMALYDDWTMQLHRWFSFWTAWHLGLMAQVTIAAIGMYAFLRGRSIDHLWACCGAIAYAANSQFVTWIYHRWALGAFCWVPWILWAIDSYRQGRRLAWTMVPIFIAMAFLGGTLQHAALVVLVVMAMWLDETGIVAAVYDRRNSSTQKASDRHIPLHQQIRLLGRYSTWGALGIGLAAMMFLPCIDAFLTSNRLGIHTGMVSNAENSIYPEGPLQALFNLAAYPFQIFPSILGRCDSLDTMKGFKSELFYIAYFGSLPVGIAFLALWRKQSPTLARLLIGAGLILPLTPLVRILYQRLFLLFIIGGILAFAHFMQFASRDLKLRIFKVAGICVGIIVLLWTLLSVTLHLKPEFLELIRQKLTTAANGSSFGYFHDWIAMRVDHFLGDLLIWSPQQLIPLALLIAALWGLKYSASNETKRRLAGGVLVTMAVICEVSLFGSRWLVWVDPIQNPLFPATPESVALHKFVGKEGRVSTMIHPTAHMAMTPFIPNTLSAYGIATISGYDSIVPNGMVLPNETPNDAIKLGRFGVTHLVTWPDNPEVGDGWDLVWKSSMMELYQNLHATPRYTGWLSSAEKNQFFEKSSNSGIALRELTQLQNQRRIDIPAGVEWVRIAENQADGWEYRISSGANWSPVERAPDASMLLHNSNTGTATTIEMRYQPPLRRLGLAISAASLLLLAAGAAYTVRSSRRDLTHSLPTDLP